MPLPLARALRSLVGAALALVAVVVPASARQPAWQVGEHVEAYNVDWYAATVTEVGTGNMAGYYKVHFDAFSAASDQYIRASNIRARADRRAAAAAADAARAAGPRVGRYRVLSFGASATPIVLGELELLDGGRYRAILPGGRPAGDGRYAYDAASGSVRWLSGPYRTDGWGGAFTVERDGKTHQIRLRGGTVAVNSTDR